MTLRRMFNNPALTSAISIALLLVALVVLCVYLWPRPTTPPRPPDKDPDAMDPHASIDGADTTARAMCATWHNS